MPEEEKKEQVKEDEKVVVLTMQTDMHCNACQEKINKVVKNFPGVEKIDLDAQERKVVVKGKMDAKLLFEAVKNKCGKGTKLLFPQLAQELDGGEEKEKPKDDPPPDVTVELKISMHCGACAKQIKKMLAKVDGVTEIGQLNQSSDTVIVKGKGLDALKLCETVRKSGKHCLIVSPLPNSAPKEEKKEELKADTKAVEEKKDEKQGEKQEESSSDTKFEVRRYAYPHHYQTIQNYVYAPQIFSDENPNSCIIM